MMRAKLAMTLSCIVTIVTGCASLSPEQCQHADWRQIGFVDGVEGRSAERINDHADACAKVGVRPDLDAYLRGREQGFIKYCQPDNGFLVGRAGEAENSVDCPAYLKPAFLAEYARGAQIHAIEADLRNQRSRIQNNHAAMRHSDDRIHAIRTELARSDLAPERRKSLLDEFNLLIDRKSALVREDTQLQWEASRMEMQLDMRLHAFGR